MRLDLRDADVFLAVVRQGSFGRAATELVLTQPAVSERVRHLERLVGRRLFERTARGATLTPAGEHLLPYAQRCVALAEEAVEVARGAEGAPHLVVAVHSTFAQRVMPLVLGAVADAPRRVSVRDAHSNEVQALVLEGVADLGFALPAPTVGAVRRVPLAPDPVVCVAAPDHALARARRPGLESLGDALLAVNLWGEGADLFLTRLSDAEVEDWRIRRFGEAATALALARGHDHVAFVTRSAAEADVKAGTLKQIRLAGIPRWTVRLELLYRTGDRDDATVRTLVDAVRTA